ncbi:MAG TPA: Mur ligase domain-containing protein, partial [Novosphingobium sp.]|nr:Mur ligase domain-containing protein [Novosphingobium sp.]
MAWPANPADNLPQPLWTIEEVAKATGGKVGGAPANGLLSNVATDSREIVDGGLFFAMQGEAMDGHRFIPTAFERGAGAAIVERSVEQPHVLVKDSFAALQALAAAARARVAPE